MAKIQQLSPHIANLIAAGEVVERPASCAKELVENAVDAHATQITVEIKNGGMTYLRVTDNGCGIPADELETAFLRHATSKLQNAQDLEAIRTLGFRGEALAAIASVSRMDVLTKTADAQFGISLHLEGGAVTERSEAGCPNGTTMIVRDLFYNTPARMKFMRSDSTEASALLSSMQRMALAHPEVSFRVIRDGEVQLETAGDGSLYSAIYAVMGRQNAKELVAVDSRWDKYRLSGYVSKPTATRGNRSNQIFFVNGRLVRSKSMTVALEEAYRNRLTHGRYPSCVLHLQMPEHLVDVNVHPAKVEVKFLNERDVFDTLRYGVEGALERTSDRPAVKLPDEKPGREVTAPAGHYPLASPKPDFYRSMSAAEYRSFSQALANTPRVSPSKTVQLQLSDKHSEPAPLRRPVDSAAPKQQKEPPKKPPVPRETPCAPAQQTDVPQETALPIGDGTPAFRLVGEVLDTYIVVEHERSMLLIDKHAAHERILFEKLRRNTEPIMPQLLLTPIVFSPEREEGAVLLENEQELAALGFAISDYGDGTLAVSQIPSELQAADVQATLNALASDLMAGKRLDPAALRESLLHTLACKAAVKGGRHSNSKELEHLVREVLSRPELKYCPHGRPICISLSAAQLERQFKR